MRTGTIFFCAALFLVAGCAEIPRPTNFPYSSQRQFQSATHWQRIAKELIWERLIKDDELVALLKPDSAGSRPRIYVQTSDKSPFDEAFRNYLITELINARFLLSDTRDDAPIRIHWDLQLISRDPERLKPIGIPEFVAGEVVAALSGIRWNTSDPLAPHTELILTTKVTVGGNSPARTIKSYSDTFYINDGDWDNYNYELVASSAFRRSITGKDEAWRRRLQRQGLLSQ